MTRDEIFEGCMTVGAMGYVIAALTAIWWGDIPLSGEIFMSIGAVFIYAGLAYKLFGRR